MGDPNKRTKKYLQVLFESGARPTATNKPHPEDRKLWLDGVAEMAGREAELLEDFGPELARMILVYPDTIASEMLAAIREHVWLGNWKGRKRPSPLQPSEGSKGETNG